MFLFHYVSRYLSSSPASQLSDECFCHRRHCLSIGINFYAYYFAPSIPIRRFLWPSTTLGRSLVVSVRQPPSGSPIPIFPSHVRTAWILRVFMPRNYTFGTIGPSPGRPCFSTDVIRLEHFKTICSNSGTVFVVFRLVIFRSTLMSVHRTESDFDNAGDNLNNKCNVFLISRAPLSNMLYYKTIYMNIQLKSFSLIIVLNTD